MPKITKKTKQIELEMFNIVDKTNIEDFIEACDQKIKVNQLFEDKTIDITSADNLPLINTTKPLTIETKNLSFQISNEDVTKITNQLVSIIRNPIDFAELLKNLDNELGEAMLKNGIQFNDGDLPEFIIAGKTHYIPGPPPSNYCPKKKERLLDTILLMHEKESGINLEEYSSKFSGAISNNEANQFVASGHVFTENKQVSRLLLHGSFSHRIMFEAIRCAIKCGKLSLKYGDGKELNMKQFLELLVYTQYYYETGYRYLGRVSQSLWTIAIDTVRDSTAVAPENEYGTYDYLNPDHYSFSCCSPFVLNSLLLCFGKELELPNLQHYLLDSHYKAAYEMIYRIKNATSLPIHILDGSVYIYCMQALSIAGSKPGDIGVSLPFTLPESEVDSSYLPFDSKHPIPGIVKKINKSSGRGQYGSWPEFFHSLSQQSSTVSKNDAVTENNALNYRNGANAN